MIRVGFLSIICFILASSPVFALNITRDLKVGDKGEDVKALQVFLNKEGFLIASSGAGSKGKETTFFGPATAKAVKAFQESKAKEILTPNGLTQGTGMVGPSTRSVINTLITTTQTSIAQTQETTLAFPRDLKVGDKGEDVKALQVFLNKEGFLIASSGAGSKGKETTFFGPATAKAVKAFQESKAKEILTPNGLTQGTGYFGSVTRQVVTSSSRGSTQTVATSQGGNSSYVYGSGGGGGGGVISGGSNSSDTTAPTIPSSLVVSSVSTSTLSLSWSTSTDAVGVTAYRLYRGDTFLATTTSANYNDSGLTNNTSYSYNVSAVDAAANFSATSTTVSTSTLPDTASPSVPTSLTFSGVTQTTLALSWASSTDDVAVTAYRLYRGNTFLATTTSANYSDSGLTQNTSYSYNVSAVDAAANFSATSTTAATTTLATVDGTAPSIPTSLTFGAVASTSLIVAWATSTDNVAVSHYKIYRDNSFVGTTTNIWYTDTGLVGSSTYSYSVSAVDTSLNVSATSSTYATTTTRDIIWWVSKTGSDSNDGRTRDTAFATFHEGLSSMSSGDTLYIDDGIYYGETVGGYAGNYSTCTAEQIPNGTTGRPTRILGYNSHAVTIDNQYTTNRPAVHLYRCHDIELGNIVVKHGTVGVRQSSYIHLHHVGAAFGDYTDSNVAEIYSAMSDHVTIEDSWAWGYGARYPFLLWAGHHNVLRRNVARYDGAINGEPRAGMTIYSEDSSVAENNIVIDFDGTGDSYAGVNSHTPFFVTSSVLLTADDSSSPSSATIASVPLQPGYKLGLGSVSLLGNIVVNAVATTSSALMWVDSLASIGGTITFSNNVIVNASNTPVVAGVWISNNTVAATSSATHHDVVVTHNTISNINGPGIRLDDVGWLTPTFNDNLIATTTSSVCFRDMTNGSTVSSSHNQTSECTGSITNDASVLSSNPQLLYPLQREAGTPGTATNQPASDSGNRGATILKRYQTTPGSAPNLTNVDLWNFPTQDYVRADFCSGPDSTSTAPTVLSGTVVYTRGHNQTGWCGTSKTLTDYIWESLGRPSPYGPPDTEAPSVPASLAVGSGITQVSVNLTWASSTDNVAVTAYRVYRNSSFVATSTSANYTDSGLTANTSYSYTVSAVDAAANVSTQSASVSTTTLAEDFSAPSTPASLTVSSVGMSSLNLTWASSTDNLGVTAYRIYRDNTFLATSTSANYTSSGLTSGATYSYNVAAFDAAANFSATSTTVSTTTLADPGPVVVQSASYAIYNSSSTLSLPSSVTSGNWILIGLFINNNTIANATISDNQSHSGHTSGNFETIMASSTDGGFLAWKAVRSNASGSYTLNLNTNNGLTTTVNILEVEGSSGTTTTSLVNASSTYGAARFANTINSSSSPTTYTNNLLLSLVNIGNTTNTFATTSTGWSLASSVPEGATTSQQVFSYKPGAIGTYPMHGTVSSSGVGYPNAVVMNLSISGSTLPDTTAPTIPASLAVSSTTPSTVSLSWASSTDTFGVSAYRVYRNNTFLATSTAITYTDTGLTPNTSYSYNVAAVDAAANFSATSTTVSTSTLPDTAAPSVPASLTFSGVTQTTLSLSWASSTDNVAVTAYRLYRGNTFLATTTSANYSDSGLTQNTSYSYNVAAVDAAANFSATSTTYSTTTLPADVTAPSVPDSLTFSGVTQTTLSLSWSTSTDAVGVTAYRLYRGDTFLATTTSANYNDTGLTNNTSYSYNVAAVDAAANFSATSTTASTSTLPVAISVVRDTGMSHTAGGSNAFSFSSLPSAGNNIIVLCSGLDSGGNISVSDNQGGTSYSTAVNALNSSSGRWTAIRYRENISSPSGTFTITATLGGNSEMNCTAIEVSGLATSSSLDQTATKITGMHFGGTPVGDATTTNTLAQSNELVVTVVGGRSDAVFSTLPAPSGFTLITNRMPGTAAYTDSPAGMAYQVVSSTTGVTTTWSPANVSNGQAAGATISVATFKSQ